MLESHRPGVRTLWPAGWTRSSTPPAAALSSCPAADLNSEIWDKRTRQTIKETGRPEMHSGALS